MVVGGAPDRCSPTEAANKVALFALDALVCVKNFHTPDGSTINIRAGKHNEVNFVLTSAILNVMLSQQHRHGFGASGSWCGWKCHAKVLPFWGHGKPCVPHGVNKQKRQTTGVRPNCGFSAREISS